MAQVMVSWEVRMSNSRGVPYFFNAETKQSSWDAPGELSDAEVQSLPGAKEYLGVGGASASANPVQVRASHLLVKHKDSRRPSSWKEANITRTKEEAIAILKGYQEQIDGSQKKFAELAQEHSDCSSHSNQGDLSWFKRGQMQKPFEDATYALQVGQISDIISTDSGVHLIMRTG
ncbi:rotamase-domain-containing protein [Leucogyrophana mollusca]|uniref:Rotamase-domain-containing protein n=1 Tax=Leucogyrophana mollusca TaxID=85980 RepID=A0ACB8BQZ2_9AGAM|nr:rotamase-domain-containing protein [Leucogyrophana mollusca]